MKERPDRSPSAQDDFLTSCSQSQLLLETADANSLQPQNNLLAVTESDRFCLLGYKINTKHNLLSSVSSKQYGISPH